jgi:hypothetical protein
MHIAGVVVPGRHGPQVQHFVDATIASKNLLYLIGHYDLARASLRAK